MSTPGTIDRGVSPLGEIVCPRCHGRGRISCGTIGGRLKALREARGLGLNEASEASGVDNSTMCRLEGDKTTSTQFATLVKLADFYAVTLDYLLGRAALAASGEE